MVFNNITTNYYYYEVSAAVRFCSCFIVGRFNIFKWMRVENVSILAAN